MSVSGAISALPQFGMLVCTGPAARHFLQGQLSCDTEKLGIGRWVWGGYLTVKGRLLATFLALGLADEQIGLVMNRGLMKETQAKLAMYRLRAKVQFDIDPRSWFCRIQAADAPPSGEVLSAGERLEAGLGEQLAIGCDASEPPADEPAVQAWRAGCAAQGMPWFDAQLQDKLTAHMVSLDLIGGIDFDKGCYLGQEIVIRSHHRGTIKRRAYVVAGAGAAPAGAAAVLSERYGDQKVGQVLYAAAAGSGWRGLASLRKDAAEGALSLEGNGAISAAAPPYGLLDTKFEAQ